jgi:dTDP-4-amino-4,6-dideoxygalactose transaminase
MKVPFVDLQAQYTAIKDEIDRAIADVMAAGAYIGGTYVSQFEEDFAVYSKETLSLPMFPEISKDQLKYVCNQVRNVAGG